MSVLYITALKNIDRGSWEGAFQRPIQSYYNGLTELLNKCPKSVAFLDKDAMEYISSTMSPKSDQYTLLPYEEENTFLHTYLETEKTIMNSNTYNNLIKHRKNHPEHFCGEYNLVNHNKVIFLKRAAEMFPDYEYYVWIDVHYTRWNDNNNIMPTNIYHLPKNKLSICCFLPTTDIPTMDAKQVAAAGRDIFQGSLYVVPKNIVKTLHQEYIYQLEQSYQQEIADDDQSVHHLLYLRLPKLYNVLQSSRWGMCIQKMLVGQEEEIKDKVKEVIAKEKVIVKEINEKAKAEILKEYNRVCNTPGDIVEHLPVLHEYTVKEGVSAVLELGTSIFISSWAFLQGLSDNQTTSQKRFITCDLRKPNNIPYVKELSDGNNIDFSFLHKSSLDIDIDNDLQGSVDITFIDTWHVYGQLKRELAKFAPITKKYIIMHDTEIDGEYGESLRDKHNIMEKHQQSGIPVHEITRGLKYAVEEFLRDNEGVWEQTLVLKNNNGLTVLTRTQ